MPVKATIQDGVRGATLEFGTATSDNPASIAAGAEGSATLTITGADTGDMIFVSPRGLLAGLAVADVTVTATDTVVVKLVNTSAGALDDAAASYDYMLVKVAA